MAVLFSAKPVNGARRLFISYLRVDETNYRDANNRKIKALVWNEPRPLHTCHLGAFIYTYKHKNLFTGNMLFGKCDGTRDRRSKSKAYVFGYIRMDG